MTNTRLLFGFCSLRDVWTTIFSKNWTLMGSLSAFMVYVAKAAGYLHSNVDFIYLLFVLMLLDWATGSIKALKLKNFNSFTFQRFFLNLVARFGLIGIGHWMGKSYWAFALLNLENILAVGFILTEFVSLLENIAVIEPRLIPAPLMAALRQVTNIDKVLKRFYPQAFVDTPLQDPAEPAAPAPETPAPSADEMAPSDPTTAAADAVCADKLPS